MGSAAAGAVLILVATDVDAICAARALARLLTEDEIMYRIAPVDGFKRMQRILAEDVAGNEDVGTFAACGSEGTKMLTQYPFPQQLHTLVLLNLGSLLSLPSYFGPEALPLPAATHIHLIDSHRPWNLDNLFATNEIMDRIWVWDDGDIVAKMQKEREAYESLEFDVDSDEDDESDSESESADDEESGEDNESDADSAGEGSSSGLGRKRKQGRGSSVGSQGDDHEEGQEGRSRRRKKARKSPVKRVSREQKDVYRAILTRYYHRGTGLGMSVAGMIFTLAEALGRAENEGLWLAILGLTHQYVSNAVPYYLYDQQASSLASDVLALNPPPPTTNGHTVAAAPTDHLPRPATADDGRIRVVKDELRFTLYRHWSLESAMYHTPYVAGKLGVWREKGLIKIRGLLAKMGFSLIHSRQHHNNMPLDLRSSLISRLESIAPEYGLAELVFRSFIRSFGYRSNPLSAMDTVEGLNALLTAATGIKIEVQDEALTFSGAAPGNSSIGMDSRGAYGGQGTPVSSELFGAKRLWSIGGGGADSRSRDDKENNAPPRNGSNDADGEGEDQEANQLGDSEVYPSKQQAAWVRNFFATYEALDTKKSSNLSLLNSSLSLARSLHSAILSVGTALIDKQSIRSMKSFRLAILRDGPHLDLFAAQPSMLTRLGLWLTDALRDIVNEQDRRKIEAKKLRKEKARLKRKNVDDEAEAEDTAAALAARSLPFVLCALNQTTSTYLVVGLVGSNEYGDIERNRFGLAFQDAIKKSGARSRYEGWFDTGIVEIRQEDLGGFVERLHLKS